MEKGPLKDLILSIARLPGLGPRSARRIVLHMLKNKDKYMYNLASSINNCADLVTECEICHNLDIKSPCSICQDTSRQSDIICLVSEISDLWAIERSGKYFKGKYHILGGNLNALQGITPEKLNISSLVKRIESKEVKEVLIALSSNLEGQTTSFYITDILKKYGISITRIAHGIPIGADLDCMDEGTLSHAINMRHEISD